MSRDEQRKSLKLRRKRTVNYSKTLALQVFLPAPKNNCAHAQLWWLEKYNSNWLTVQTTLGYGTKPIFKTNYARCQLVKRVFRSFYLKLFTVKPEWNNFGNFCTNFDSLRPRNHKIIAILFPLRRETNAFRRRTSLASRTSSRTHSESMVLASKLKSQVLQVLENAVLGSRTVLFLDWMKRKITDKK